MAADGAAEEGVETGAAEELEEEEGVTTGSSRRRRQHFTATAGIDAIATSGAHGFAHRFNETHSLLAQT